MNCPFNQLECPEHNKKGGCALWLEVRQGDEAVATMSGCSLALTPMLLAQNINMLACVAKETNQTSAEVSALRVESIKENQATREQLYSLATGNIQRIEANHTTNTKGMEK